MLIHSPVRVMRNGLDYPTNGTIQYYLYITNALPRSRVRFRHHGLSASHAKMVDIGDLLINFLLDCEGLAIGLKHPTTLLDLKGLKDDLGIDANWKKVLFKLFESERSALFLHTVSQYNYNSSHPTSSRHIINHKRD